MLELTERLQRCHDRMKGHVYQSDTSTEATLLDAKAEIERLRAENDYIHSEALRLKHAVEYAHSEGFEWPHDPIPKLSLEHDPELKGSCSEIVRQALHQKTSPERKGKYDE